MLFFNIKSLSTCNEVTSTLGARGVELHNRIMCHRHHLSCSDLNWLKLQRRLNAYNNVITQNFVAFNVTIELVTSSLTIAC